MLALCPDTRTPAKKILAKSTSSANLPPVTVCPIYNRQDPTNKNCSLQIRKMIRWQQTALEGFFDCTFSLVDWDFSLVDWIEARFAVVECSLKTVPSVMRVPARERYRLP
jgi:hypothetical protein